MSSRFTLPLLSVFALGASSTSPAVDSSDQSTSAHPRLMPAQVSAARAGYASAMSQPLENPQAKKKKPSLIPPVPFPAAKAGEPSVLIRDVKLTGNERYDDETLKADLEPYLGKKLSFSQIVFLTHLVEHHYRVHGYQIVKTTLPQGGLNNNVLTIHVTEGKLGGIQVAGNMRYSDEIITNVLLGSLEMGRIFRIADAERPLVLLNSYPALTVASALEQGDVPGTTKMIVEAKEEKMFTGSLEFNNFGSESSGEYRAIPFVALRNPLGLGDQISAFAAIALDEPETWSYQLDYTTPINSKGTGLHAYFGQGSNTAGNEFEILDIQGDSNSWGIGLTHRYIWSAKTQMNMRLMFDAQDVTQDMLGMPTIDDAVRKLRLGADFTHSDSKGKSFVSFYIHQGLGELLGGMDRNSTLSSRAYAQADNGFTKMVLSAMRLQRMDEKFYGIFNVSAQWGIDPLVSSEQLYIGGVNSVRGQPYSMSAGDSGVIMNAELRYNAVEGGGQGFSPSLQLAAFLDYGTTNLQRPSVGYDDWTNAAGAGVGLRSQLYTGLDGRLDIAIPVGHQHGDGVYLYAQLRYSF